MSKPLITVVLPSLNVKEYIETCIRSVIDQSLHELEILCVDAGSTDGTLEILEKYALLDERIKIIHSDMKSYGKQVNMGFDIAKGKYVAVVETDDYIEQCMYEKLYRIAEENQLDFIKADFKGFRTLGSGQHVYDEGKVGKRDDIYGKVLSVREYPELYTRDVNIWKGIYNKDFLVKNGIWLNETQGAAFQDIGFCLLALLYAKRGMYVPDMLYYYRRDSVGSSSRKPQGLRFAYQEFKRLLNWPISGENKELFFRFLYIRASYVFVGEYEKILEFGKEMDLELQEIVRWFQSLLARKIEQREIIKEDVGGKTWNKLLLLIEDEALYVANWYENRRRQKEEEGSLLNRIGEDDIIVFGCGRCGMETLLFCDKHNIKIRAFSDNDSSLWRSKFYGYEVYEVSRLQMKYCDVKILISTQKHQQAIREQLNRLGIREECILVFKNFITD